MRGKIQEGRNGVRSRTGYPLVANWKTGERGGVSTRWGIKISRERQAVRRGVVDEGDDEMGSPTVREKEAGITCSDVCGGQTSWV